MALVNSAFTVNVTPGAMPPVVHVSEYDVGRTYTVTINGENGSAFNIPTGTTATVEGTLNGSVGFTQSATISNNQVSFALSESMTAYSGKAWCKIKLTLNNQPIQTCAFVLVVDRAGVEADTVIGASGFEEQIREAVEDMVEGGGTSHAVLYTPMSLTPAQQEQARSNIGAASMSDIPSLAAYRTASAQDAIDAAQDSAIAAKYTKPSGGIPKTDLASAVQTSLGKADTALQTAPVTSVNNKTGAVTLTASDVGALPSDTPIPAAVTEQTVANWGFTKNAVRYDEQMALTDTQKATARTNIGAVGKLEYDALESDIKSLEADLSLKLDAADAPTKVSDLQNDTGFVTAQQAAAAAPVQSVNGKTGAVTLKTSDLRNDSGFITAQDVPAAPVQSVNSKTGAVTVREVPDAGGATVGQVLTKTADGLGWTTPAGGGDLPDYSHAIDGQVLTKTEYGPRWANNNPSSGAALRLLYEGAFGPDDPDLMLMGNVANTETGNAIATALYTGRIGSAVLVDVSNSNTEVVYDLFAVDYDAQTHVSTVTFARTEGTLIRTATLSGSTKTAPVFDTIPLGGLPSVTAADNGKFLRVVSGAWAATAVPFQTPRVAMTASDTTPELDPNKLYVFPEMASLAITLAAPTDNSIVNEYHFIFVSGATATTLTLPASILQPDGFTVEANMHYEVSILEGAMTTQGWAVTA